MLKAMISVMVALLILESCFSALIFIPGLPVSTLSLYKTQIALNRWEKDLYLNYGK